MNDLKDETRQQVLNLLGVMSDQAAQADRLCARFDSDAEDLGHHRDHADLLRQFLCRLGWLADLAAGRLESDPCPGSAERWLLPPALQPGP